MLNSTINQDFFLSDAISLAKNLLGKILVRTINGQQIKVRIVETEAYMGANDRASHSYQFRKTSRTLPLYQIGGTTYIYLIYGMYYCFNIVANAQENPQAVLVRAGEIISGQKIIEDYLKPTKRKQSLAQLASGPGKLAMVLKIDRSLNQISLLNNQELTLIADDFTVNEEDIIAAKRINIDYAKEDKEHLWRFYLKNHLAVSK
ncbi:putative 3-methyladenine DNA glycosylase [Spiroplasma sp. JKS002671]|uniref:DNA-3-methyladenine glycosylase n=1 Tax=Spiroplasma attinicola TaxID=2904537 RepID=UPI002022AE9D|nr:DNA-3-methyladenine glycosylase [Spiroplasma sp. JKS002671]MCL8210483.1 putative 3-methyladenine DNA glycosylase [Spiroplasma sp. JKS002671]